MKLDALDHPKTLDLAARLSVELPTVIGHLELLWAFTGKKAPQGDIGKWPDGAIARACHWMGRPEVFLLALRESGFIEPDDAHRFTVHDWSDHAPGWVRAKLKKLGLTFLPTRTATREPSSEGSSEPSSKPSIQGKGREEKRRHPPKYPPSSHDDSPGQAPEAAPELPPGLDPAAWKRWHDYRREIRKPLKPVSLPAAQRELAAFGCDQSAVVEQSIANGYQGLFDLKKRANGSGHAAGKPTRRLRTADEIEAEEASRAEH